MDQADQFSASLEPAVSLIKQHVGEGHTLCFVSHNDADGVASGGVLSRMALRMGAHFRTTCEKRLDEATVRAIAEEKPRLVIFSDFGSGYLDLIGSHLGGVDVIVLDHHLPVGTAPEGLVHVNPILHGIDGARDIAASGISYALAKRIDGANGDLSTLGIVGALGDQQDKGPKKTLTGLNTLILKEAEEAGLLQRRIDLIFYGYETRPVAKALAYTMSPFIPGLSGAEDRCVAFLSSVGVELKAGDRFKALRDLSEEEKRTIFSSLGSHMVSQGCDSKTVHDLIGTVYTLKAEEPSTPLRDGREYSSLLNACARMGRAGVGLGICLGDRGEAMREAETTVDEYRRKIGGYLDWVRQGDHLREMEAIYILRAGSEIDDTIVGVVSSILLNQGIVKDKPIVASAASDDGTVKISARGTEAMASDGLHLGRVLQEAAAAFRGAGGGHDIAAGAYLPAEGETDFMVRVNELVKRERAK
jgi:single-stranded-DNA-specific exonuclease